MPGCIVNTPCKMLRVYDKKKGKEEPSDGKNQKQKSRKEKSLTTRVGSTNDRLSSDT